MLFLYQIGFIIYKIVRPIAILLTSKMSNLDSFGKSLIANEWPQGHRDRNILLAVPLFWCESPTSMPDEESVW